MVRFMQKRNHTSGPFIPRFHLPDESWLKKFAHKRGVPMYDAGVLGYPKRMKDYRRGETD